MKHKIDALTSLRFFAAALIVVLHGTQVFGHTRFTDHFAIFQAVGFFYVLSGFVLAYNYSGIPLSRAALSKYALARAARVLPVHLFTAALAYMFIVGARGSVHAMLTNVVLLQAWIPGFDYSYSLNGVSWSISDEAFFYAMLPLLLLDLRRTVLRKLAGFAAITASILYLARNAQDPTLTWANYVFPLTRLLEFFVGVAAFHLYGQLGPRIRRLSMRSATLLEIGAAIATLASMHFCMEALSLPGAYSLLGKAFPGWFGSSGSCLIFGALILILACEAGKLSWLLARPPLVYLGNISFALYMIHQIIVRVLLENPALLTHAPTWIDYLGYICAALLGAEAIHRFVENPARTAILHAYRRREHQINAGSTR
ncbi:peptidoglycan/LPS O-acetylase OafA/YrhL [Paraburkholderia sp. BL6665CI2N2]|uniref:acyltransferase family protein n=1 Tax=Paraburkholderia sp. BL6665CI2N2 TaxID=1938806 RepID=UPI0010657829|nr:acyltransferase [Paraburkholderia sp. BL6665CI2N2]TDY22568.1 peptidoglycan/LPS O-acetylase OafA/YrhL [Paraburkholderia sp. BL6665CI2N2]